MACSAPARSRALIMSLIAWCSLVVTSAMPWPKYSRYEWTCARNRSRVSAMSGLPLAFAIVPCSFASSSANSRYAW